MRQQYDTEFKQRAVQLVREDSKPGAQVARELGIPTNTLYQWVQVYREDPKNPFVGSGPLKPEDPAQRALERPIRDLAEENAI
ncbi:MAG: transposase [Firmicutes bacterium]|nr:transposase [Bacillota bacterium]